MSQYLSPDSMHTMHNLKPIVLIQTRPKFLRITLGIVYSFFLINGIGSMAISLHSGIPWLIWLVILFSTPLIVFCLYLLRMNRDPELTLTSTGFSERTETDYRVFKWSDVECFEVYHFRARNQDQIRVGFKFSESFRSTKAYKKVRLTAKAERVLTGYDWHLSNFYGKTPEQLATLLNQNKLGVS
jgi:hypothetical protein